MPSLTSLIITTISNPNDALKAYSEGCYKHNFDFIVIGDTKSPHDFRLKGCCYFNIQQQTSLPFSIINQLPVSHYARKNVGYLIAFSRGAETIIETDDDNYPYESFWANREPFHRAKIAKKAGWINIYRYFTDLNIWPRGFPLELIQQPTTSLEIFSEGNIYCPIQQGLANDNPDVDAIYRLINPQPVKFNDNIKLAIGRESWCPFNSQNTTWFKEAFPLLYIPSFCNFRMCDILRSFVALRICFTNNWHILFHGPTVWQDRNPHNLMADFKDEIPGYLYNKSLCEVLSDLDLKSGVEHIGDNLLTCYESLVKSGHTGSAEIDLLRLWLNDIDHIYHEAF